MVTPTIEAIATRASIQLSLSGPDQQRNGLADKRRIDRLGNWFSLSAEEQTDRSYFNLLSYAPGVQVSNRGFWTAALGKGVRQHGTFRSE